MALHDPLLSHSGRKLHLGAKCALLRGKVFIHATQTVDSSGKNAAGAAELASGRLFYYRARYYDPAIGRFISEDPMGFDAGDVNFYAYAANNPINHNDPSGHILPAIAAGCAAAPALCAGAVSAVSSMVIGAGVRYFS